MDALGEAMYFREPDLQLLNGLAAVDPTPLDIR
jgi:hypothetical protein